MNRFQRWLESPVPEKPEGMSGPTLKFWNWTAMDMPFVIVLVLCLFILMTR